MTVIRMENIYKSYQIGKVEVPALKGITLSFEKGEFTAIAGPSGSGKTTMLNLLGCLDKPTEGKIFIEEKEVTKLSPDEQAEVRNFHIGFIFQTFNLIHVLTAYENVEFPLLLLKIKAKERKERVMQMLAEVGIANLADRRPNEMSGGQQQRVAIARALIKTPSFVLADEPTANIDTKTGHEILNLMQEINRKYATTFIFSTHDPQVMAHASRLIKIRDGQVEGEEKK